VLEHLNDPLPVLVALDRALAAGGRVIVSVPNVAHLWVRLSLPSDAGTTWTAASSTAPTCASHEAELRGAPPDAGLSVEELVATPVPLPLVVPPRLHGPVLDAVHALSAGAARAWKGGLAYQFVAVCRRASAEPRCDRPTKVVVVMPAYNAGRTLRLTYEELPKESVSLVILVDDGSKDQTLEIARELGLEIFVHDRNYGYGANQKPATRRR